MFVYTVRHISHWTFFFFFFLQNPDVSYAGNGSVEYWFRQIAANITQSEPKRGNGKHSHAQSALFKKQNLRAHWQPIQTQWTLVAQLAVRQKAMWCRAEGGTDEKWKLSCYPLSPVSPSLFPSIFLVPFLFTAPISDLSLVWKTLADVPWGASPSFLCHLSLFIAQCTLPLRTQANHESNVGTVQNMLGCVVVGENAPVNHLLLQCFSSWLLCCEYRRSSW